ncbi:MAG: hypothetical protein V4773_30120, partial [Verrucomicrobiota bacterium]
RRSKQRKQFWRYVPNPLRAEDTTGFVHQEHEVIMFLQAHPKVWIKLWSLINYLAGKGTVAVTRPRRQMFLAIITRMIREKKLIRYRPANLIALQAEFDPRLVSMFRSINLPAEPLPATATSDIIGAKRAYPHTFVA